MADEDELFAGLEAQIESEGTKADRGLRKYWKQFDATMPPADDGSIPLEPAGSDLQVVEDAADAFEPDDDDYARANSEYHAEVRSMSLKGFLRRFTLLCVIISIGGLYTQWVYRFNREEKFSFVLGNTWPLLLFGGMLFGLCIEQVLSWIGRQALALWQWWRFNMLFTRLRVWRRAPKWQHTYCCCWRCKHNKSHLSIHYNHCCCARCRLKRHWTYWKHLKRYPKGWKSRPGF